MSSLAPIAGEPSLRTEIKTVNIAVMPATLPTVTEGGAPAMDSGYRTNLESYLASMLQAKNMLSQGVISSDDYIKIDTIICSCVHRQ